MIHVIGNAAVDSLIRVDELPRPGETIVALGASEDLGGKGANQAVMAARCGASVRLVAPIGDDALGERIRWNLAREGVEIDGLMTSSYGTDRCVIAVDRHGENTILSLIDAARNFDPIAETKIEEWISPGDLVVMQAICGRASRAIVSRWPSRKAPRPFSAHRQPTRGRTTTGTWLISYWPIAARRLNLRVAKRRRPRASSARRAHARLF
jgi:sugar/nucleoside kinase (ribokinase family)